MKITKLLLTVLLAVLLLSAAAGTVVATGGMSHISNLTVRGDLLASALAVTLDMVGGRDIAAGRDLVAGRDIVANGAVSAGDITGSGDLTVLGNASANSMTLDGPLHAYGGIQVYDEPSGGNAGARNMIIGVPRVSFVALGAMTDGTTLTVSWMDDSPTGEYAPLGATVTEAEGSVDGIYKIGLSSYKATFDAAAVADDGFKSAVTPVDLEAHALVGFWLYSDTPLVAGDLQILLTDDGGERNFDLPEVGVAGVWQWIAIDISALTGGAGDAVSEFGLSLTAQGEAAALGEFSLYVDGVWVWKTAQEIDLGELVLQDGVLGVLTVATAAGSPNTLFALDENTDFFVHYDATSTYIVLASNQAAYSGLALIAY